MFVIRSFANSFGYRKFWRWIADNHGMSDVYEPVDYGNHTFFWLR